MNRDILVFASEIARASVPLVTVVLLWCALVWDSPTYMALALLGVAVACVAVRPETSPGSDRETSAPDAGDHPIPASGAPSTTQ